MSDRETRFNRASLYGHRRGDEVSYQDPADGQRKNGKVNSIFVSTFVENPNPLIAPFLGNKYFVINGDPIPAAFVDRR